MNCKFLIYKTEAFSFIFAWYIFMLDSHVHARRHVYKNIIKRDREKGLKTGGGESEEVSWKDGKSARIYTNDNLFKRS